MIMCDKGFWKYISMSGSLLVIIILFHYETSLIKTGVPHFIWMSNQFFVFQLAVILLVGNAFINRYFNRLSFYRFISRQSIVLWQLALNFILAFAIDTIIFSFSLCISALLGGSGNIQLVKIISVYLQYIFASVALVYISLCFSHFPIKIFRKTSQLFAFFILALELQIIPKVMHSTQNKHLFLFSWMNHDDYFISCTVLLCSDVILFVLLIALSCREDLLE